MDTLPVYELTFEVSPLSEATEDELMDVLDAFVSVRNGATFVTFDVPARNGVLAATSGAARLRSTGAVPHRLVHDLVTRSEIARRAGVSPQAVGQWLRGDRHADIPAPTPWVSAGADLWIWGEVVVWLELIGQEASEPNRFPSRSENQLVNGWIASTTGWTAVASQSNVTVRPGADSRETKTIPASDINVQASFGLAA